ncbi:MAG: carbohydrate kinase family protein [Candidatus Limnocylindria bacterium]
MVAVVGDALLDVTLEPSGPIRPGGDVPSTVRVGPGGQGANVAVRLARRGASARLACAIGDDAAGRLLREALEVDAVRLHAGSSPATGAVAILLGPGGERSMLSQRVSVFSDLDLPRLADGVDWLVISGYALLEEGASDFAARCAALPVRRAVLGCTLPDGRLGQWRAAASGARADLVILNADEARALAAGEDAEALAAALAPELGAVVIVTGERGASAAGHGLRVTIAAATETIGAVDTTGAGDAFAASVIAGLGRAWPPHVEGLRAVIAGALSVAGEVVRIAGAQGPVASERAVGSP